STPDQQLKIAGETPIQNHARLPLRTTWEDLEDGIVYIDIECDIPLVHSLVLTPPSLVGTPASPKWSPELILGLLVIPSSVASPAPVASLNEDALLEIGAQLELYESILHTHTERLDALPPSFPEGHDWDITKLFSRSEAVCEEIQSHHFRLRSLERMQEESRITMGTLWGPILTLLAWIGYIDAPRGALWQSIYEDR
ncbi:hypothetical protein Tco_1348960, partial [Tanacetum coccineum]